MGLLVLHRSDTYTHLQSVRGGFRLDLEVKLLNWLNWTELGEKGTGVGRFGLVRTEGGRGPLAATMLRPGTVPARAPLTGVASVDECRSQIALRPCSSTLAAALLRAAFLWGQRRGLWIT